MRKQTKKDPASHPGRKKTTTTKTAETTSRRISRGKTTEELMDKMLTDKNAKISDEEFKSIMLESSPGESIQENKRTKSIEKLSKPSKVEKKAEDERPRDDDGKQITPWNVLGQ